MTNLMAVHLDPSLWENPNSFDPSRHIDSDGQLITNSGNFLPFSAGRRVCAGEALAKVRLISLVFYDYLNKLFLILVPLKYLRKENLSKNDVCWSFY